MYALSTRGARAVLFAGLSLAIITFTGFFFGRAEAASFGASTMYAGERNHLCGGSVFPSKASYAPGEPLVLSGSISLSVDVPYSNYTGCNVAVPTDASGNVAFDTPVPSGGALGGMNLYTPQYVPTASLPQSYSNGPKSYTIPANMAPGSHYLGGRVCVWSYLTNGGGQVAENCSQFQVPFTVSAPLPVVPGEPTGFSVTTGSTCGGEITLRWNAPSGASSYEVQRDGGAYFNVGNVTTWTDTGLAFGSNHSYRVRALNSAGTPGNSTPSMSANASGACPPVAICGNGIQEGGEQCDLGGGNGACPSTCSTSCTVNSCPQPPPAPSCSSVAPETVVTYDTSGTLYVYAYGVANATAVNFAVWGNPGGQDDLVWYSGTNMGGGTWRAPINLAAHKAGNPEYGNFNVHVYMNNASYINTWCGAAGFSRLTATPSVNLGVSTNAGGPWSPSAIVPDGTSMFVNWSSANATRCNVYWEGWDWLMNYPTSGTVETGSLPPGDYLVDAVCYNASGTPSPTSTASISVQAPTVPPPPASITGSCDATFTGDVRWDTVGNATGYALRIDNQTLSSPWSGVCNPADGAGDSCLTTNQNPFPITGGSGHQFSAWVHACNAAGCSAPAATTFSCPPAPTTNLTSVNAPSPSGPLTLGESVTFSGTVQNSGTLSVNTPFTDNFTYRWGSSGAWNPLGGHIAKTVPFAPAGTQGDTSVTFALSQSGALQVQHCTDSQGQVAESDESVADNCKVATLNVSEGAGSPECSDGVDNSDPEDTIADYPADPGCSSADDDDETDGGGGCATPPCSGGGPNPLFVTVVGSGSVSSNPAGISGCTRSCSAGYGNGASVTLTATPDPGETFRGWSEDCSGSGACVVTMNGRRNVTATFSGGGGGTPQCSNGIDDADPEDTIADYPADPGCASADDDDEIDGGGGGGGMPTLTASPRIVKNGETTTLTWTLGGGSNCSLTGGGLSRSLSRNGSADQPISATTKFIVSCPGGGTASVWVYIDPTGHET